MRDCLFYTLSECVDNLMADRGITKKKFFAMYLQMAKKEWQKIFRNTLWEVQTRWQTLKLGDPYNFIDLPQGVGISRIFGISVTDHCGLLQPLFYNSQLDVVKKPLIKQCGCDACECGGLCNDVNSFSMTTKVLFTINGVDYIEKTWLQYCKNGDILEYKEIPTKKYLNITGDGGDFNDDYNDDYSHTAAPFSDYVIVYVKQQKKICKLETLECGCPKETEENTQTLINFCGCNLNFGCGSKRRHCKQFSENINNNHWGEVKISECGTKFFYKPPRHCGLLWHDRIPEFLQITFQTNGLEPDNEVLVPDFAIDAMEAGINWRSMRFNSKYSGVQKKEAEYQSIDETNKVVAFLNPIDLVQLGKVQDAVIRW